ncbi:DegT/DnrJ/EryC1/StrS family aminotransferase [Chloroflexota bacterium]
MDRVPLHPFYQRTFGFHRGDFPNTEWIYDREVSLPLYPRMREEDVFRVASAAKRILEFEQD